MNWVAIPLLAYGVASLIAIRPLAGHFAWSYLKGAKREYPLSMADAIKPTSDHWFLAYTTALVLAVVWPVVAVVYVAGKLGPVVGAEREAQLLEREHRLRAAEKDLGLEPWEMRQ